MTQDINARALEAFNAWASTGAAKDTRGRLITEDRNASMRAPYGQWAPEQSWEELSLPGTILMVLDGPSERPRYADMPVAFLDSPPEVSVEYQAYLDLKTRFA